MSKEPQTTPVNLRLQEVLAACGKAKETKGKPKRAKKTNEIKGEIKKMTKEENVKIINNEPMVSSVHVAVILGKDHYVIKKTIQEVIEEQGSSEGVVESTFKIARNNRTYFQYYIDFKRFDLVADKFPSIKFDKTKYIQEFNEAIERNMKAQVSNVLADEPVESNEIKNEIEGETKKMTNEQLVTIINNQAVVSSRQVAESFGKEHRNVTASIRDILGAEKSATNFFHETSFEYRGQKFPEYLMNRDGFTLLAMGFNGHKALQWKLKYIQAFNEMEEQLKNTFKLPQTYKEALVALVEQVGENEKLLEVNQGLELKVSELEPKATHYDQWINGTGYYSLNTVAKLLGTGRNRLIKQLKTLGFLTKERVPYQRHMGNGKFVVKVVNLPTGYSTKTTLVSPKGVEYIAKITNSVRVS